MTEDVDVAEAYVARPPRWVKVLVTFGFAAMVAITVLFFTTDESRLWKIAGVLLSLLFAAGVVDVMTGYVALGDGEVVVRSNFRTRRIPWSDVTEVKREGARIWLRLHGKQWYGMPEWCEGGMGFYNRVSARHRRHRGT